MNRLALLHLTPYIVSMLISLGVYAYTWRRREVAGAAAFSWFVLSEILYTLVYALELVSNSLDGKLFWGNLRFVTTVLGPLVLLNFAITFTRRKLGHPRRVWTPLLIVSLSFILILYTDKYHHLVYPVGSIALGEPFSPLVYEYTPVAWLFILYGYTVGFLGILLLISRLISARKLFRPQMIAVVLGILMPLAGVPIALTGVQIFGLLDPTYVASSIGSIIIAMGLFRYRLFDIVPVARDMLVESMQDAVFVLDTRNRLIDANPAALAYLNNAEMEVLGRSAEEVIPDWDSLVHKYRDVQNGTFETFVGEGVERAVLSFKITELLNDKGSSAGHLVVVQDVTEQKRAEQEIRSSNRKLEALNVELEKANEHLRKLGQVRDEFFGNVSHELRTPITNIKLHHDLIELQPERSEEFLETLSRETDRLSNLIERLLMLSRFDQGITKFEPSAFDLETLAQEYLADRLALAESRGLTLSVSDVSDGAVVCADRDLVGQVLSILLTNALNYTPEGGNVLINILEREDGPRKWVGFSVKDSGIGISPEDQKRLFSRFFRGNVGRKSGISGTGLGLSIAKEIIDRHGGTIKVESEGIPGEGSTFSVWLPLES